jgi:hypothetical protein
MIELTDEMVTAVRRRMGDPDGIELDPWMTAAIEDVLALVERDYVVTCGAEGPDGARCERPPHARSDRHGCHGPGSVVAW